MLAGGMGMNQRGAALVTVLLVAALATVMAVALATRQQVDIRRTANIINNDQAYFFGLGVESWVIQLLKRDARKGNTDNLGELWAQGLFPTEIEGGVVSGYVEDMQGRFNLNNLVLASDASTAEGDRKHFRNMLSLCELDPDLVNAVIDWLDADSDLTFPQGAEDDYYLQLDMPYRAANTLMKSPSELLLVRGFDMKSYVCLAPNITALPEWTEININTMTPVVLASLSGNLGLEKAGEIIDKRPDDGYENLNTFGELPELAGTGKIEDKYLSQKSGYFMAHTTAIFGRAEIELNSLFKRKSDMITVLSRTVGN